MGEEIGYDTDDVGVAIPFLDLSPDDHLRVLVAQKMKIGFIYRHCVNGVALRSAGTCQQAEAVHAEIIAVREFYLYIFTNLFFPIIDDHGARPGAVTGGRIAGDADQRYSGDGP